MLHVHRSERADCLADGLAATLLDPLDDPLQADVVSVPTRGIERWLAQRLSTWLGTSAGRQDGICANVEFPFPRRLIGGALATATGIEPDEDPWVAERSVWPLHEIVDECLEEPWLATLKAHLEGARAEPDEPLRRFGVLRHIAELFDRYGIQRPEMIRAWAAGEDIGAAAAPWQAELWRRLQTRIGVPSPAERLEAGCARIRADRDLLGALPPRLSLFGLTRMPRSYLEVLAAIAEHRDVHLFVLHPSPALWEQIAETGERVSTRHDDPTAHLATNRLLASWGRDARELQLVLAGGGGGENVTDHHHPLGTEPATLLERIQQDIHRDRHPAGGAPLDASDRSIQIHACHGRARQVEVLRDAVLHLLQSDEALEPRDVIVMCPDIEAFAPLIQATFGAAAVEDEDPALSARRLPDLRVRLADRSLRQTNPILAVVSQLLALAQQRGTASQLLDLADRAPVRRRFQFDDDELARLRDWVAQSGIRWGLDAAHRTPFKLQQVEANTWKAGLDRTLLGVAMTEEDLRLLGTVLPLDDVDSGAIDLAGRVAEFVERLTVAIDSLSSSKPIAEWAGAIAEAADALTATTERESWQRTELQIVLDDVVAEATPHNGAAREVELEPADIRALLADRLRGRPTRANFRTGHLTICTLVPMRSVPHRVICLLGLDDGEFPRKAPRDGDDLILRDPHVGDRDPRSEDRQMLLDALLAASERLIVTYSGNDERTNLPRPPAVPVAELLETIDRTVTCEEGRPRDRVLIRHPLQPFDPRNFNTDAAGPWGFDQVALAGARALTGERSDRPPFLAEPLEPRHSDVIELDRLIGFVQHPAKAFLRDRLEISVSEFGDEVQDALPVELDGLGRWQVGQRLLDGVLEGQELARCVAAEKARGTLPPRRLAESVLDDVSRLAQRIGEVAREFSASTPSSLDANAQLPDGRRLSGTVAGVCGDTIRYATYSKMKAKDRLRAWVQLLALTAARPERPFTAVVVGRAPYGGRVTVAQIPSLGNDPETRRETALEHLRTLIDLYERGMREPLPLACETAAAYAWAANRGLDPVKAAGDAWTSSYSWDKEDRDPEHLTVFSGQASLGDLLSAEPRADESETGWNLGESSRFGRYARRLWDPLLEREQLEDR